MPDATLGERIMRSAREALVAEYLKLSVKGIQDPVFVVDARGRPAHEANGKPPVLELRITNCTRSEAVELMSELSEEAARALANDEIRASTLNVVVIMEGRVETFRDLVIRRG